jgi:hypothetical protein
MSSATEQAAAGGGGGANFSRWGGKLFGGSANIFGWCAPPQKLCLCMVCLTSVILNIIT